MITLQLFLIVFIQECCSPSDTVTSAAFELHCNDDGSNGKLETSRSRSNVAAWVGLLLASNIIAAVAIYGDAVSL